MHAKRFPKFYSTCFAADDNTDPNITVNIREGREVFHSSLVLPETLEKKQLITSYNQVITTKCYTFMVDSLSVYNNKEKQFTWHKCWQYNLY